jgi:hypothetical protein
MQIIKHKIKSSSILCKPARWNPLRKRRSTNQTGLCRSTPQWVQSTTTEGKKQESELYINSWVISTSFIHYRLVLLRAFIVVKCNQSQRTWIILWFHGVTIRCYKENIKFSWKILPENQLCLRERKEQGLIFQSKLNIHEQLVCWHFYSKY